MNRGMGPKYMFEADLDSNIQKGNAAWKKIWGSSSFFNTNCFHNGTRTN